MKKWLYSLIAVAALVLGFSAATTANASSWHKGTPSSLRGKYAYHYHDGVRGSDVYQITKSSVYFTPTGDRTFKTTGVKYQKIGKYYRLLGTDHGNIGKYKDDSIFYKKGHSLKVLEYSQYKHGGFSKDHYVFHKF